MFFNLPTLLTWARIVAIPLIVGLFYLPLDQATRNLAATGLFIAVAITDWADGYLARRLNQTSAFGAFLDPVADKFLICAALLILLQLARVDAFVARDQQDVPFEWRVARCMSSDGDDCTARQRVAALQSPNILCTRSRRSWASSESVAVGRASSRATPIGSPVSSQNP